MFCFVLFCFGKKWFYIIAKCFVYIGLYSIAFKPVNISATSLELLLIWWQSRQMQRFQTRQIFKWNFVGIKFCRQTKMTKRCFQWWRKKGEMLFPHWKRGSNHTQTLDWSQNRRKKTIQKKIVNLKVNYSRGTLFRV